jgi:hypothetical protein
VAKETKPVAARATATRAAPLPWESLASHATATAAGGEGEDDAAAERAFLPRSFQASFWAGVTEPTAAEAPPTGSVRKGKKKGKAAPQVLFTTATRRLKTT